MAKIIRESKPCPGGRMVTIEVTNAYTDGRSRFDAVFIADNAVAGKSDDARMEAIATALEDPTTAVRGYDVEQWKKLRQVSETPIADLKRAFSGQLEAVSEVPK